MSKKKIRQSADTVIKKIISEGVSSYPSKVVQINNLIIEGDLNIHGRVDKHIHFENCDTINATYGVAGSSGITFEDCSIEKLKWAAGNAQNLNLSKCKVGKFENDGLINIFKIKGCIIDRLDINSKIKAITVGSYVDFKGEGIIQAEHIDSSITNLVIQSFDPTVLEEVLFEKCSIGYAGIIGDINEKGLFRFNNCKISTIKIIALTNKGRLEFTDIKLPDDSSKVDFSKIIEPKSFNIHNSKLNLCVFENIDITQYENVNIENTNLKRTILTNVVWPHNINKSIIDNAESKKEKKKEFKNLAETYKQLNRAHREDNDKIQQISVNAYYLNAYRKSLGCSLKDLSEKFLLFIGRWTNNFRLSWPLPLFLLFFGSALIFACMICFEPKLNFESNWSDFFKFLNPARSYDYIPDVVLTGFPLIIDFLGRVFVAFIIFQLIQAIRKHTWTN